MGYTNSGLAVYKKLSPNHSGQRTHSIDRIIPHCVVGQSTAEGLGDWFAKSSTQASSNYGIDKRKKAQAGEVPIVKLYGFDTSGEKLQDHTGGSGDSEVHLRPL